MSHRLAASGRVAAAGALTAGLLVGAPGTAAAAAAPICTSDLAPKLAARLSTRIRAAESGRTGTVSVAVWDREHKLGCYVGSGRHFDSASTVKVTIVAALLRYAEKKKRSLTAREKSLAKAAITRSDNNAASALWSELGHARIQRLLDDVGMRSTYLGPGQYWGLTQITATDELRLLLMLTRDRRDDVLTLKSRHYLLGLMHDVVSGQRWGTPAGATGVKVHVKNGWLPRATHGWRVHSLGTFDSGKRDYVIVVLTHGNPSMGYGITTIERVSKVIHSQLDA